MRYMYHATPKENLNSILEHGLRPGIDGCVYLCEQPKEAIRFLLVKQPEVIVVFEIAISDEDEARIKESFDHSFEFFQCRAYGYNGTIPKEKIIDYEMYGKNKDALKE